MRWVRGASAVILASVLVAGCGGSGDEKSASSDKDGDAAAAAVEGNGATTTTTAGGEKASGTPTTTAKAGSSGGAAEPKGTAATGSGEGARTGAPDDSEPPGEPLPMEAQVSSTCVRPGTPLTVTVKSAPNAAVGYDTTWADGKNGLDAPNRGGTAKGTTDHDGTWKNTATIGADAPRGKARVQVIGVDVPGRSGFATVEYQVSDALGKCS